MSGYYDTATPTEQLVIDLLIARWRLGDDTWTLPSRPSIFAALCRLEQAGYAWFKSGVMPRTHLAGLTKKAHDDWAFDQTKYRSVHGPRKVGKQKAGAR